MWAAPYTLTVLVANMVTGVLRELAPEGVSAVHDALIAEACRSQDEQAEDMEEDEEAGPAPKYEHVLVHYYGSRALRRCGFLLADNRHG